MAYAVGYGKAIISTPYLYAKEMLAGDRGLVAEFSNADSLAGHIERILRNPNKKAQMEKETLRLGKTMYWDRVAYRYMEVFFHIMKASPKIEAAS